MKKLTLIAPISNRFTNRLSAKFHYPPLALAILAANTPDDFEIEIIDESFQVIDLEDYADSDIVGISALTPSVKRGYEIADFFKKKGITVIMGGHHVSALPEEALQHADAVIIGEGDYIWREIMDDYLAGKKIHGIYKSKVTPNLEDMPLPRIDLYPKEAKYLTKANTHVTRGCPNGCSFCSVTKFSPTFRKRPVDDVINELTVLKDKYVDETNRIFFNDDNPTLDKKYAKELFTKMIPIGLKWQTFAGIDVARDDELLRIMKDAGCTGLIIGFDAMNLEDLNTMNKKLNTKADYIEVTRKLQNEYGIPVIAAIVVGFDHDTKDTFDKIIDFLDKSSASSLIFNILYPYPGTDLYEQYKNAGRLTSYDWDNYIMDGINFVPQNMTQEELHEGYLKVLKWYTSEEQLQKRIDNALNSPMGEFGAFMIRDWYLGVKRAYEECTRGINTIRA